MQLGVPKELFGKFAQRRRQQMSRLLLQSMQPDQGDTCLELGGPIVGLQGVTERFRRYIVLNLDPSALQSVRCLESHRLAYGVRADAVCLPFPDKSVDYLVSNALLEHVMPPSRRPRFAEEVRRVARKGYFISAPNFWFPLEPHYFMPFFQFLPESLKRWLVQRVSMGCMSKESYEPVSLSTTRELRRLFPEATVTGLSFTGAFPETIIAWQRFE